MPPNSTCLHLPQVATEYNNEVVIKSRSEGLILLLNKSKEKEYEIFVLQFLLIVFVNFEKLQNQDYCILYCLILVDCLTRGMGAMNVSLRVLNGYIFSVS